MISIVIASYDRPELLLECCRTLACQDGIENIEVIIVDNAGFDGLDELLAEFPTFRIIREAKRGASQARNTGIELAKHDWVLFLDDDVKVPKDCLKHGIQLMKSSGFDVIGGHYRPWYPYGKPNWLPSTFGRKPHLREDFGEITPGDRGFLSCGILAVKTEAIKDVGLFATDIGMRETLAYGEEDELQLRLKAKGYRLAYAPEWWLEHAVLDHKLNVPWHWRSAFARRRDSMKPAPNFFVLLFLSLRTCVGTLLKIPTRLGRVAFFRNYFWQNMALDIGNPIARRLGEWTRVLSSFRKK